MRDGEFAPGVEDDPVRLTLRTLLAYLDDTLDPAEIKVIGQKVAESETAQELINRIKQVTRRRRLTTPPTTGPQAAKFDADTVAEYLDNELTPEKVAEVEKICLDSDVHLAEIATCHQILTLVLGEPALVPPKAKERMYGLSRGREAIPNRKAPSAIRDAVPARARDRRDEDDVLTLGLPLTGRQARWVLPVAAVLLLGCLAALVWFTRSPTQPTAVASNSEPKDDPQNVIHVRPPQPDGGAAKGGGAAAPNGQAQKPPDGGNPGAPPPPPPPPGKPSAERTAAGKYHTDAAAPPSALLRRDQGQWKRLPPGATVETADPLVSLPGFQSEVRLDSGVHLLLWGNLPHFGGQAALLESAVVLHHDPKLDADLTLDRGRVYVANRKRDPARVRLRFLGEVWDLTLGPDTEVGADLASHYPPDVGFASGEPPLAQFNLCVLKGRTGLRVDYQEFPVLQAPPGPAAFIWTNKGKGAAGPFRLDKVPEVWDKAQPAGAVTPLVKAVQDAQRALVQDKGLNSGASAEVVLREFLQQRKAPAEGSLAVFCLGAIDGASHLLDALADESPAANDTRYDAVFVLRNWIGRGADNETILYNREKDSGLLREKGYTPNQSLTVMKLLHDFSEAELVPATYSSLIDYLQHNKVAIRQLAYFHLTLLAPEGRKINYSPAGPKESRDAAVAEWKKLIPEGSRPQPPKPPGP